MQGTVPEGVSHHEEGYFLRISVLKDFIRLLFDVLAVGDEDGTTVKGFLYGN